MKRKLYLILLSALCLMPLSVVAQENASRQIYHQAESEYNIGHVEQALSLLHDNIKAFEGNLKQSAYRLLALCYLSEDRDEEARYYAEQLVKLNNYYNSTDDPARFQDLVNKLKEGIGTTITTASSQSESINEAPAPVTIITAEMIDNLGYNKNLAQILAAYVPGMVEMTSTNSEVNLAMHGAYAYGQELILIMENGHRLNTHVDNGGPVSYSVSTEKIDHIEVLRGPTSSLYGNVALSAVVNVITKNGNAAEGVKLKYGHATYNTHKADLTMGTQFMDADIFVWASLYNSDGQKRHLTDGEGYLSRAITQFVNMGDFKRTYVSPDVYYVDGYKDKPAYDFGVTLKLKGFNLMLSRKNVKKVLQYTPSSGCYDYDKFSLIQGIRPGQGNESTHAEIGYSRQMGKWLLNASLYGDWYNVRNYEVEYDSLVSVSPVLDENYNYVYDENGNYKYKTENEKGYFSYDAYYEHTMGAVVRASSDYQIGSMKGSVLAGGQFEYFSLNSRLFFRGLSDGEVEGGNISYDEITKDGKDKILSLFVQDKHYCLPQLILNAGFRYDHKYRKNDKEVNTFSPRLALMYVPNERFSLKLSYSEAFADLSFYNRYITKVGEFSTKPQHLSAIQLTVMGNVPSLHLNYEANIFYKKYTNLLCWQSRFSENDRTNFIGRLTNVGIEGTARLAYKRLSANLSLCFFHDISAENYYYNSEKNMVCGAPHFTCNLHGAWKLVGQKSHEVKLYGHSRYIGRKLNFQLEEEAKDFFVAGKLLFDIGVKYRYRQRLQLAFDCENLFNTDYYICGPSLMSVPELQRGRTLMASLSYQF